MNIAFDFDGTICDSMPALEDLAVDVIQRYWKIADENVIRHRYRETSGDPFDVQLPRIMESTTGREIELATAAYEIEKKDVTMRAKPRLAAIGAIQSLLDHGASIHIVSSTKSALIWAWIMNTKVPWISQVWCHGIDYGTKLDHLQMLKPTWFVGDSVSDRDRAEAVGARFCHVDSLPATVPVMIAEAQS